MSTANTGFFAVDRRAWARVCALGLNPAVAYLVVNGALLHRGEVGVRAIAGVGRDLIGLRPMLASTASTIGVS